MKRTLVALLLAVGCLAPTSAQALEITYLRPAYGPMAAMRKNLKFIPGDVLYMSYVVSGLKVEEKTNKVKYTSTLEFLDAKNTQMFKKDTPNELTVQLGGTSMPGDLHIVMGRNLAPGKYTVKLTVKDQLSNDSKAVTYPIEVIASEFGFVGVTAPAVGLIGQHYLASFAVVDMGLDAKKMPNVEITIKLFDDKGTAVAKPTVMTLPKDIPEGIDIQKESFVPLSYPLYLNRSGRFTVEIVATDRVSAKTAQLRYQLTVFDLKALDPGQ
jgi:hypothetical protein